MVGLRWIAAAGFTLVGCHTDPGLSLHAALGEGGAMRHLTIVALPFDAEAILDSLAAATAIPKPTFPGLEDSLAQYRHSDLRDYDALSEPWHALRDSVARLADSLAAIDRRLPAYAQLYTRFRAMYGRLAQRAAERDARWKEISGDEFRLARRAQQAADTLRSWEAWAFAPYEEIAARELIRLGHTVVEATTDTSGTAHLTLAPGRWWIVAQAPMPANPFQEYAWSVAVRVSGWLPMQVPLHERNAIRRWRH